MIKHFCDQCNSSIELLCVHKVTIGVRSWELCQECIIPIRNLLPLTYQEKIQQSNYEMLHDPTKGFRI